MTDNLPAIRTTEVATQDTDSWIHVVDNVAALASNIANTEFVPKGLRGSAAATAAAILYGREVGLPPMTALTQTHVIEGKPAISAEGMRGLILAAGHGLQVLESNGARCVMRGRRRGEDEWSVPVEWSLDMARNAGLAGKQVWKSYPRQMLQARCTAELARLIFPDVIHGFRALEEFDESDGATEGLAPSQGGSSTVQRKRGGARGTKGEAVLERTERPALEGPPLPGEEGFELVVGGTSEGEAGEPSTTTDVPAATGDEPKGEEVETAERPETPADPPPPEAGEYERPATKPDLRMYFASFKGLGDDLERDERLAITCQIIGRIVSTSNELSQREARLVADTVARFSSLPDLYALLDAQADPA